MTDSLTTSHSLSFRFLLFSCFFLVWAPRLLAQSDVREAVPAAERLLEEGKVDSAMQLLTRYLFTHSKDSEALRLLGRALYWSGQPDEARTRYEEAMVLAPQNVGLRLEYARMLAETGGLDRAREILIPLTLRESSAAGALELLGTIKYWEGDWTAAQEFFVEALARDPGNREARRQLNEIAVTTASTASLGFQYGDDSQPLRRSILTGEVDLHLTPLQRLRFRAEPQFVNVSDTAKSVLTADVTWKAYFPPSLETELSAGIVTRSFDEKADWTWKGLLGLRLPNHLALRAHMERLASLYASASFSTPVMTTSGGLELGWNHPSGRMGRASMELIRFPDGNTLRRISGWILLPLSDPAPVRFSVGYGYNAQHAEENRFTLVGGAPSFPGSYIPYYTPTNLSVHSLLGLLHIEVSSATEFHLNGSYGVFAREDAPSFVADTTPPQRTPVERVFLQRDFRPFSVRATLTAGVSSFGTLGLEAFHSSNSFYDFTQVNLKFSYRFLPSDER